MSAGAVCGIQARLSSTRLPGKVLADLEGAPLIEHVFERARRATLVDEVVILTSDDPSDDPLADALLERGLPFRRGSLQDVRSRFVDLVEEFDPRYLVRVTGDMPLVEPEFLDLQVAALQAFDADFCSVAGNQGGSIEGTLGGQGAFSTRAFHASLVSEDPRDLEHVSGFWFRNEAERFRFVEIEVDPAFHAPGLRLCVDEAADLDLVRRVFARFRDDLADLSVREVLRWIEDEPSIQSLNRGVRESADNLAARRLDRAKRPTLIGKYTP